MVSKAQVLKEIVETARAHRISLEEISAAIGEEPASESPEADNGKSSILTRVLAYLGGIFVFAGLGVFISMNWESMNFAARVVITLGSGIAAYVLALIALNDERYEKAATPLFLIAALLQPVGLLVVFEEFYSSNEWDTVGLVTSGAMAIQQILTLIKTQRTTLLFTGIVFVVAFLLILFDMLDVDYDFTALVIGASLLSLSVGLDQSKHKVITPFWYFIGSSWFMYAVFSLLEGSVVEILFLAVVSGLVYLSTVVRSRTLLFVSTVGMLTYIGYFSEKHFVQSIGWPIALVLFGLLLIGLSSMAFRISKKYIRAQPG